MEFEASKALTYMSWPQVALIRDYFFKFFSLTLYTPDDQVQEKFPRVLLKVSELRLDFFGFDWSEFWNKWNET